MTEPLVTVLTPTYNHARFIADCIRSVQAQTYLNWEQVIVDDGSTDATEGIVSAFDDDRICYVRQRHVGIHRLAETYNRGLKLSRGDFIAVLEGDDMYPKRKLELQIDSLADDAILSFGKYIIIDQDKKYLGTIPRNFKQYMSMTNWLQPLLMYNYIPGLTVMVKKEALIKIGGFTQPANTVAVDYSTYLELALVGRFRFVNAVLGIWRRHVGSYSDSVLYNSMNPLISDVALQYVIPFCRKHGFMVDWKALAEQKGRDLFHIARHQLLHGNKREALRNFKQSFKLCSAFGKLKSIGGMAMSVLNVDLERVAARLGRPTER
jgi:glycosyltransferase involved in cell wall biosynthesis